MAEPGAAAREWRTHWPLVLASMVALSLTTIGVYSLGLFMEPLSRAFGWSRAQISSGLTIVAVVSIPLGPFAGAIIDRLGSRRVALPAVLLSGAAFSLFALMEGSLILWWAIWLVYGLVTMGVKSMVWTAAVSSVFHAGRGLALAVVLCGSGIGATGVPILANLLIADFGWRWAYLAIGLGWSLIVFALLFPLFYDARDRRRRDSGGGPQAAHVPPPGLSVREAWRSRPLQKLALTLMLLSGLLVGMIVHLVPILESGGVTRSRAAALAGLLGIIAVPAKLTTGWLIDRLPVGLVAGVIFVLPSLTCAILLAAPASPPAVLAAVLVMGWSSGGYFHLATYLTSRFAGLLNFGKVYGFMTSGMAVATGIAPVVAGAVFDRTGSYRLLLIAGIPIAIACGMLMATLGRFPDWSRRTAPVA